MAVAVGAVFRSVKISSFQRALIFVFAVAASPVGIVTEFFDGGFDDFYRDLILRN
jgi:hypothetical protein